MSDIRYDIVDVSAQSQYTGHQLAVVQPEGKLSGDEMQRIANEFDYSETTFINPDGNLADGFDIRIFSPTTVRWPSHARYGVRSPRAARTYR